MRNDMKCVVMFTASMMFFALLGSAGSTTNAFLEEDIQDRSFKTPTQEYEIIIWKPLISVPVIQERGETIRIWVSNPMADEYTPWEPSLYKTYGSYEEEFHMGVVSVEKVEHTEEEWYITCTIPDDAREELYDLRLNDGMESTERIQSVSVVSKIKNEFNFVTVTDLHTGATHGEGSVSYIRRFFNEMNLIRPDFIVLTGDACDKEPTWWSPQDPHPSEQDEKFFELLQELHVPAFIVHGNHDYSYTSTDDPDYNIQSYKTWINPHLNYSFFYGDYHFVMQNSGKYVGTLNPDGLMTMDNVTWMVNELADNMDKTMRIVGIHHPVYPDNIDDNSVRDAFRQAVIDYDVAMVLAGHTHSSTIYDAHGGGVSGDPTQGEQPLHVTTGDLVKSAMEYRLIRISENEIETITYDTNGDGERDSAASMPLGGITVDYFPANDGTDTEITATIENELYEYFDDAFVNFTVAPPELGYQYIVENATVSETIDWGDKITFYARTDINISSTKVVTIRQELISGEPPSINITSPMENEQWYADTEDEITWTTEQGDDPIDHIDIFYSNDAGITWSTIATEQEDTGSFMWTVPNDHSEECLVSASVYDVMGRYGKDSSGIFEIIGIPPEPPENLAVQHHGTGTLTLFQDDVEDGDLGYIAGTSESPVTEWDILSHGATSGMYSWDFGDGEYYKTSAYGYLSWLITPEIEIPEGAENVELSFEHWRDFAAMETYLDGGNLKISTTGAGGDFTLITPNEGYDGEINPNYGNPLGGQMAWGGTAGWETVTFNLTAYVGENIHLRWDAGIEEYDDDFGQGWRVDDILIIAEVVGEGDEHNLLTWNASPDDPDEVSHYNIYRSEEFDGVYDYISSVLVDGSAEYEYLDIEKGMADGVFWWYVVRAVGTNGLEEENNNPVQEPGAPMETFDIPLYAGGNTSGWNFVSFNLIPADTSLEAILADIAGNYDKALYFDASTGGWSSYVPGRADRYNNLDTWNHQMGMWIHMDVDDILTITGTAPTSTDITLQPGWTMVGLPSEIAGNHGLPGEIDGIGYFDASQTYNLAYDYSPGAFVFEPGKGYWLYNSADEAVVWTVNY